MRVIGPGLRRLPARFSLLASFLIPLNDPRGWELLAYKNIQANTVTWSKRGMEITVKNSASPVIYPLSSPKRVRKVAFKGTLRGGLVFPPGLTQGERGADDFVLRIGLVLSGTARLGWFERKIAPDWVLKLQSLAPKDAGIEKVLFLNLSSQKLPWTQRVHPLSKYFEERIVGEASAEFSIEETLVRPVDVVALWISVDGDDTKEGFSVTLSELRLEDDSRR